MKKFQKPETDIISIKYADVLTSSGTDDPFVTEDDVLDEAPKKSGGVINNR